LVSRAMEENPRFDKFRILQIVIEYFYIYFLIESLNYIMNNYNKGISSILV